MTPADREKKWSLTSDASQIKVNKLDPFQDTELSELSGKALDSIIERRVYKVLPKHLLV